VKRMENLQNILTIKNMSRRFGGFYAVKGLDFNISKGRITGLVGPNGAGKTTTFNLLSGFLQPSEGSVNFKGRDITGYSPDRIARMGLARTFQLNKLFTSLTVEDNIRNGCHKYEKGGILRFLFRSSTAEQQELEKRVESIVRMTGLEDMRSQKAGDLSYGDQKLLSIGIALGTKPSLLMLDEPFAGMNQTETGRCVALVKRILETGATIFLVDHNMRAIMGICEQVLVLNFGEKVAEGKPEDIQSDPKVISCYLGSEKNAESE
jgi:branched-chain amino acid transport system ATP-binding protein